MEVRVVGAVYSEARRSPKKAKMQEDHHNGVVGVEAGSHDKMDRR